MVTLLLRSSFYDFTLSFFHTYVFLPPISWWLQVNIPVTLKNQKNNNNNNEKSKSIRDYMIPRPVLLTLSLIQRKLCNMQLVCRCIFGISYSYLNFQIYLVHAKARFDGQCLIFPHKWSLHQPGTL